MSETRTYAQWAGNPKGVKENVENCIQAFTRRNEWHAYQCERKRGHGPEGLYCKQHAKRFAEAVN